MTRPRPSPSSSAGVIETPDQTAALITPDRTLARRVAARLKAYDLAIDDSAGTPVARTVPGAFLDLMLSAVESDFAAPDLMALLKHPLALLGRPPAAIRRAARALERAAFRDIYVGQGLGGVAEALRARARGNRRRRAVPPEELREADRLVADLRPCIGAACGPLCRREPSRRGRPCRGPQRRSRGARARQRRVVVGAMARGCRRSPVGAVRRADRRQADAQS